MVDWTPFYLVKNMELLHIFEVAFSLFLIMDPIGNAPITLTLVRSFPPKKQLRIIVRELLFALLVMIFFEFLGDILLSFLKIDHSTLRISGGVILFIISLKMIFPEDRGKFLEEDSELFFVPIAVPFFAGPSLMTAVIIYSHRYDPQIVFSAIMLAWVSALLVMLLAFRFRNLLKDKMGRAAERLMGLILVFISIQMLEDGVRMFINSLK